jgi:hypothetical protein
MRRFFGEPKKTRCFLKTEILNVTFGEKPKTPRKNEKTGGKRRKKTYTSLSQMNQVLAFTH